MHNIYYHIRIKLASPNHTCYVMDIQKRNLFGVGFDCKIVCMSFINLIIMYVELTSSSRFSLKSFILTLEYKKIWVGSYFLNCIKMEDTWRYWRLLTKMSSAVSNAVFVRQQFFVTLRMCRYAFFVSMAALLNWMKIITLLIEHHFTQKRLGFRQL